VANIFFIDDDIASELIVENLRHRGHKVERVPSVDEATKRVKQIARSDLVVLDLIMPGFTDPGSDVVSDGMRSTGMVIFQALRRLRNDLPIIVFTANQDPGLVDVIASDRFAKYISRWSSPRFQEFVGSCSRDARN
jgi:CheY-like chemotaxis protein